MGSASGNEGATRTDVWGRMVWRERESTLRGTADREMRTVTDAAGRTPVFCMGNRVTPAGATDDSLDQVSSDRTISDMRKRPIVMPKSVT